ncbi:transcriptional regulator [Virgibacillus indicus]|uniref:Transcriptional regulator n=1 Tax=Virgibacillus indicus TaxID=2024554 RepID=A0A265NCK9_9BACI|nr:helix-turn-helix transcriptional regulator [Virgibacillus indicus]OZU89551.1 transcriptional regulator [Virgibacillus indicus]
MDAKRFGRRVKAFRKLKGYTQLQFAEKLEQPIAMIGGVERGTKEVTEDLLNQIADTLAISKEELILQTSSDETEKQSNEREQENV